MSAKHSKRAITAPPLDGCLYFDASGRKVSRQEFTSTATSYPVTIGAMAAHLDALTKWMRETEAAA